MNRRNALKCIAGCCLFPTILPKQKPIGWIINFHGFVNGHWRSGYAASSLEDVKFWRETKLEQGYKVTRIRPVYKKMPRYNYCSHPGLTYEFSS